MTCKIRILPKLEDSVALAKALASTGTYYQRYRHITFTYHVLLVFFHHLLVPKKGIAALAVHGRVTRQRPGEPVTPEQKATVRAIAEALSIPVIANGGSLEFNTHEDLLRFRDETGCSSVMVARAAQHNFSIFSKDGK